MIFLILSAISAFVYGFCYIDHPVSVPRTVSKTASIFLLVIYAFYTGCPLWLVLGLALSACGDLFLSRDGDKSFLAGMVSFFSTHVAYIFLLIAIAGSDGVLGGRIVWAIVVLVYAAIIYGLLWPGLGSFRAPVAAYCVAILAMGLAALNLPLNGHNTLILLGAVLFVASDSVLAIEKFRMPEDSSWNKTASLFVWVTYWAAQYLIMRGALGAE